MKTLYTKIDFLVIFLT